MAYNTTYTGEEVDAAVAAFQTGPSTFLGFRGYAATTQSYSAFAETELTIGTVAFDTESGLTGNVFIVPASLNGKYMVFAMGVGTEAAEAGGHYLQKSTDSGSSYDNIALGGVNGQGGLSLASGPQLLVTGDYYRAAFALSSGTVAAGEPTFFSGHVTQVGIVAGAGSATTTIFGQLVMSETAQAASNTWVRESFAASTGWDGGTGDLRGATLNAGTGEITFTAAGEVLVNATSQRTGSFDAVLQIEHDAGGVGTWVAVAGDSMDGTNDLQRNVSATGFITVASGDKLRLRVAVVDDFNGNLSWGFASVEGIGGGGGGGGSGALQGFNADKVGGSTSVSNATKSIIKHENVIYDPESAYNVATGEFTVPAAYDGLWMVFTGAVFYSAASGWANASIVKDGTDVVTTQLESASVRIFGLNSNPIQVSTGEVYELATTTTGTVNVQADVRNFFSAYVVGS